MTTFRPPALDKAAPIVDAQGRITPYFQRFWQNLTFTAQTGANQASDVTALTAAVTTINAQITTINTSLAGKVAKATFTPWATATGTASRATFDTATVTLPELAQRVKALIDDLKS